jgi:hypothetical protein
MPARGDDELDDLGERLCEVLELWAVSPSFDLRHAVYIEMVEDRVYVDLTVDDLMRTAGPALRSMATRREPGYRPSKTPFFPRDPLPSCSDTDCAGDLDRDRGHVVRRVGGLLRRPAEVVPRDATTPPGSFTLQYPSVTISLTGPFCRLCSLTLRGGQCGRCPLRRREDIGQVAAVGVIFRLVNRPALARLSANAAVAWNVGGERVLVVPAGREMDRVVKANGQVQPSHVSPPSMVVNGACDPGCQRVGVGP